MQILPTRECYCPAHFGNSYEAAWPLEMAGHLAEMKHWGFNAYGDWITTTDCCVPYRSDGHWVLAVELLERKRKAFIAAQELGMALDLVVTPNHVYLDQLQPALLAKKEGRTFGQLICPSVPEAREVILRNFEAWFADFAAAGIRLGSMTAFAFDYGGCECDKCKPWILTFARLMKEIHAIAAKHHPGIELRFCSWWWTVEEHELINEWARREAPGLVKAVVMHIEYGQTAPKAVAVPDGCRKMAFVHIGYGDTRQTNDIYTKWGGVVAPTRIPATVANLAAGGFDGFQAYSEGVFDDANKALLAALASGQHGDAASVLRAYAKRYFGADEATAARWADWLALWGDRTAPPLPKAAEEFAALASAIAPSWRLEHWRSKIALETLDRRIGEPEAKAWTPDRLALVDRFWAEQEHLQRDVYRLGPVRHVFARQFSPPRWYESWRQNRRDAVGEQKMLKEA